MKHVKPLISLLLCMLMIIGIYPANVFAVDSPNNQIGPHFYANNTTGALAAQADLSGGTSKSYANELVKTNKTIVAGENENEFIVTLDVRTKETIQRIDLSEDAAVVLVIDQSPSMNTNNRIGQAKLAAKAFVESFKTDKTGVQRKIAIVGFSGQKDQWNQYGVKGATTHMGWTDASSTQIPSEIDKLQYETRGWTCLEAGLVLAKNLLNDSSVSGIANKNIILLSDGKPTYGLQNGAANSTSITAIGTSGDHFFISDPSNHTTHIMHTNVETLAASITNSGIHTYAVYLGNEMVDCVDDKINGRNQNNACSLNKSGAEWLRVNCGFPTFSVSDTDLENLSKIFSDISEIIQIQATAWIANDPIGAMYDFEGFVTNPTNSNMYSYSDTNRLITWNLPFCTPNFTDDDGYKVYQLQYKIKLNTLADGYSAGTYYATNGVTSVTYYVSQNSQTVQNGTAYFNVPSAKGYSSNISFNKVDGQGNPLAGAKFTITAQDNQNWSRTATSNENGVVEFANVPSGHSYKITETTPPEGYTKDDTVYSITVAYGTMSGSIGTNNTVTNIATPQYGNLILKKIVVSDEIDMDKEFSFTVTLSGANGSTSTADFTLKHNETVTISNIPAGTQYRVTEAEEENYISSHPNGISGTISANGNAIAEFTNTYQDTTPLANGNLTIKKKVSANRIDTNKEFSFTVTLSDADGKPLSGIFGNSNFNDNGQTTFSLKHNEALTISGIPTGTQYLVTEKSEENYISSHPNGISGTISANANATAEFTNTYWEPSSPDTGSLTVSKTVSGAASKTKKFTFTVKASVGNEALVGTYGDMTFDSDGVATFTLKHGESVTAYGLPIDTVYKVSETNNSGYVVTINDSKAKTITGKIEDSKTVTIAFDNYKPYSETIAPETGYNSNITLWLTLFVVSSACVAGIVLYNKKKKKFRKVKSDELIG